MRVDLQNNRNCRSCPYSSNNLFCNPSSERLACRRVDPKTECDNHIEIIVFDNVSASITHYTLFCRHLAFIQLSRSKQFLDMLFHACSRNMEYRSDFFDGHPYSSIRRQNHYNVGGFYGDGSSFHSYSSNAIFSILPNCPANACMSRPILSLVIRA